MCQNGSAAAPERTEPSTERRDRASDMARSSAVEAIDVTSSFVVDHAFGEIARDRGAFALDRRAVAARARRDHLEPVAGLELGGITHELHARSRDHIAMRARLSAEQAPGLRLRAQPRDVDAHATIGFRAIDAPKAHAAAEFA